MSMCRLCTMSNPIFKSPLQGPPRKFPSSHSSAMDTASILTRSGVLCTPGEYNTTLSDPTGLTYCITTADNVGLTVYVQAGLLSMIAVLYVFFVIIRNAIYRFRRRSSMSTWYIFQNPMDILMLSLFLADLLQAISIVMDLKWIGSGQIEVGEFCSAQGIIKQLGEVGVAMSTLIIAIYTFIGVWMDRMIKSKRTTGAVIVAVWFFIGLLTLLGNVLNNGTDKAYESPTPYWCWIGEPYLMWRVFGEYFWLWIALLISIIAYIPLYFWSRGNVTLNDASWWRFTIQRADSSEELKGTRHRSLIMLLYPGIYFCLTLPLSIVCWLQFVQVGKNVPPAASFAVLTIFGLSGVCNAILLLTTRPESGLFSRLNRDEMGFAPS